MKTNKRTGYIIIAIFIAMQLYQHIIYSFETNQKIIARSIVEIGPKGQSYTLPSYAGEPNQTLQLNEKNELFWSGSYNQDKSTMAYSEPFLKTRDKCPADTKFLPAVPGGFSKIQWDTPNYTEAWRIRKRDTLGYCVVTSDGNWTGILSEPIYAAETGFYCSERYKAFLPPETFYWPRLYPAIDLQWVRWEKYHDLLHVDDLDELTAFFNVAKHRTQISRTINTYYNSMGLYVTTFNIKSRGTADTGGESIIDYVPFWVSFQKFDTVDTSVHVICVR